MKKAFAILMCIAVAVMLAVPVAFCGTASDSAYGTFTQAGANTTTNVIIGFTPTRVELYNSTNANPTVAVWMSTMGSGKCIKYQSQGGINTAMSVAAANCISSYAGSTTNAAGFTLGTDADFAAGNSTIHYRATR